MLGAMTRVIGLTGGIGSGKSTVSRMFAALGAVVIDADAIVHELQAPGMPLLAEIAAAFGPETLRADGSLDRARLAQLVFADPAARLQQVKAEGDGEGARRQQQDEGRNQTEPTCGLSWPPPEVRIAA